MRSQMSSKRVMHHTSDYNGSGRMVPPQQPAELIQDTKDPVRDLMLEMQAKLNAMAGELQALKSGKQAVTSPSNRMRRQQMHDYDYTGDMGQDGDAAEAVSEFNTSQQENWEEDGAPDMDNEKDLPEEEDEDEDFVPQFGGTPKKQTEMSDMARQRAPVAVHPQQQQYHQNQQFARQAMRMRSKSPEAVGAHYQHGSRVMHADKHSVQVPHKRTYDAYQKGQMSREHQMQRDR